VLLLPCCMLFASCFVACVRDVVMCCCLCMIEVLFCLVAAVIAGLQVLLHILLLLCVAAMPLVRCTMQFGRLR